MAVTLEGNYAKERGAYFTPPQVAEFLADWAVPSPDARVLEPSCGEGVFLRAAGHRVPHGEVIGVELHAVTHRTIDAGEPSRCRILHQDFFSMDPADHGLFDAVIGNPPFIRYHRFTGEERRIAMEKARQAGVALPDLSSSWAPFLIHAVSFLKPQGRLAMVTPAELSHAFYARGVLAHLVRWFEEVFILRFRELLFPELSEDTVLVLAGPKRDVPETTGWLTTVLLDSAADLESGVVPSGRRMWVSASDLQQGSMRLALQLLPAATAQLYEAQAARAEIKRLREYASVGIDYVTGANDFFHLTAENIRYWNLPLEEVRPTLVRGRDLAGLGLAFRQEDWERNQRAGSRCYLFDPETAPSPASRSYIHHGEANEANQSYKCRGRKTWYRLSGLRVAPAILTVMATVFPMLVANEVGVVVANSLHEVFLRDTGITPRQLAGAMWNSLTLLSSEVEGHGLGGGMLKLEPSEAERLLIPPVDVAHEEELQELDSLLLERNFAGAIALGNSIYLTRGLGLTEGQVNSLEAARAHLESLRRKGSSRQRRRSG